MTLNHDPTPPPLPASLRAKLAQYRTRIWTTKTLEAAGAALFGLAVSYLVLFALDRVIDTPAWARVLLLAVGLAGGVLFLPLQIARWVGGHLSLKSAAKRIAREDLGTGDQILGVMALTSDREEFARSPELALAAIKHGEATLAATDLSHTLPVSRHRGWSLLAGAGVAATVAGFLMLPGAAKNAFARWIRPTANIERYTFTRLAAHDSDHVVARFEDFSVKLDLDKESHRSPDQASLRFPDGVTVHTALKDGGYSFQLPGLGQDVQAKLSVGDFRSELRFLPVDRPEVLQATATVALPPYLELPEPISKDARSGAIGVVAGSTVSVTAELTRDLREATWSAAKVMVGGPGLSTEPVRVAESLDTELTWIDIHGLEGTVPFKLGLRSRPDGKPTVSTEGLRSNTILLHGQAVSFQVRANDDFGVRQIGLEWEGFGELEGESQLAKGEKMLGRGEPDSQSLDLQATLHPRLLGIDPQFLRVRAFVLDALPGRGRCYSAPIEVQVMTEEEHMIWLTRSLASWFDEATEVRDQENSLLQVNEELFALSNGELAMPANQRRISDQAAAERTNGRRLSRLTGSGTALLAEAARNTQFNSNTMTEWADMMSALDAIANTRMASVADLLAKAAKAEPSSGEPGSAAGVNRSKAPSASGGPGPKTDLPSAPQVADVESSFNDPAEPKAGGPPAKAPPANLSLANTTVEGGGPKGDPEAPQDEEPAAAEEPGPTKEELAKAIAEQRALMVEFQRVAGAISEVLSNLEGSTFVKRLKALSRAETGVAQDLDLTLGSTFGSDAVSEAAGKVLLAVARVQETSGQRAALVREDLGAYVARMTNAGKDTGKFEKVHTEMGDLGVTREIAAINDLAEVSRAGEAIAGAENLADDLDRWAEILVGPG